jgi:zinc protease
LTAKPFKQKIDFSGKQSVACVDLAWPAPELVSSVDRRTAILLAAILQDRLRLRLRAEMGETYAPTASFAWNDDFTPSFTLFRCQVETQPSHARRVMAAAHTAVEALVKDGVSAEELERARTPEVRQAELNLRSNHWWAGVLATAQTSPDRLAAELRTAADLKSISSAEVTALARKILRKDRCSELIVEPK